MSAVYLPRGEGSPAIHLLPVRRSGISGVFAGERVMLPFAYRLEGGVESGVSGILLARGVEMRFAYWLESGVGPVSVVS